MRAAFLLAGPLLVIASGAATQTSPSPHQQHEATGQHQTPGQSQPAADGEPCCCEEMMRKMMSKMTEKHSGAGKPAQKDQAQSDQPHSP